MTEIIGKRALVLSGGGSKGAYQWGALKRWMKEEQQDYGIITGVSVGALNAGMLAQAPIGQPKVAWDFLDSIWSQVNDDRVFKKWGFWGYVASLWKPSVYNSEPLQEWVRSKLNPDAVRASGRLVRVGAVCWETGEYRFGTEMDLDFAEWVLASASFPAMLSPIEIGGKLWTDGGVKQVTPLGQAIRLGAEEIDVIMCSEPASSMERWSTQGKAALPSYALRAVDLMASAIVEADLKLCRIKNELARSGVEGVREIKVRVVRPVASLIENSLDFNPKTLRMMEMQGYQDAKMGATLL